MDKTAFSILVNPAYRAWFLGQAAFLLGSKSQSVAVTWLAYALTGSVTTLGIVAALTMLPYLVLSPIGGWLADRFDERRLVILTQSAFALNAFFMAGLQLKGLLTIELLLPCALAIGIISALDAGPRPALMQRIVGDRALMPKAVTLNAMAMHVSRFAGPALAGLVLVLANEWACFVLNGLTALPMIAVLSRLRPGGGNRVETQPGLWQGFRYAAQHRETRTLLLAFFCVGLLTSPYILLLPFFAKEVFAGDAAYYGALFAASGLGSLLASLAIALRGPVVELTRAALLSFGLGALLIAVFAETTHLALAMGLLTLAGFAFTFGAISLNTRIHLTVPLAVRGRVLSLISMSALGAMPIGALLMDALARDLGMQSAIAGGALLTVGFTWWLQVRYRKRAVV